MKIPRPATWRELYRAMRHEWGADPLTAAFMATVYRIAEYPYAEDDT